MLSFFHGLQTSFCQHPSVFTDIVLASVCDRCLISELGLFWLLLDSLGLELLSSRSLSLGIISVFQKRIGSLIRDPCFFCQLGLFCKLGWCLLDRWIAVSDLAHEFNQVADVIFSDHLVVHGYGHQFGGTGHCVQVGKDTSRIVRDSQVEDELHEAGVDQRVLVRLRKCPVAAQRRQKIKENHVLVVCLHQL